MAKPVHTSDTMAKLRGVLSSGPHKGQAIDAALNIVRKRRDAGGSANDPTMKNPVGWSSIYPPQYMSNQDPNVSPVVSRRSMSDLAAIGTMGRKGYVTAAELPAAEAKAKQAIDYGMIAASASSPLRGIRAFHGSPHTFDRFSLAKIGTGEGAQAYGHGLYFAGNEGVAKGYRESLSPKGKMTIGGQKFNWNNPTDVASFLMSEANGDRAGALVKAAIYGRNATKRDAKIYEAAKGVLSSSDDIRPLDTPGSMYEVNLRTSPERLLDWDAPLSAQPDVVRGAIAQLPYAETAAKWSTSNPNAPSVRLLEDARSHYAVNAGLDTRGAKNKIDLSSDLRKSGIDGIQYLDAGSRAAGDGTRNYVMFDDKLIDILRRYGLLGMIGGSAGAAAGEAERANGGAVEAAMRIVRKKRAGGGAVGVHTGPIHSSVAGRTDHLPMHVQSGSYVIPADIVSAMGEGNTMAGFKQINAMFGDAGNGPARTDGGMGKPPVPIVAAGGEYVLSPEQVATAGDGDVDMGHRVLDEWVKRMRAKTIKTLTKLPGPKKD